VKTKSPFNGLTFNLPRSFVFRSSKAFCVSGMPLRSSVFPPRTVTVFLKRSTSFHSSERISPLLQPVSIANMMISFIHPGEAVRSLSSSSRVSHLSLEAPSFSMETFRTGFSLTHSHSFIARENACFIRASSRLTVDGEAPSSLRLVLYLLTSEGVIPLITYSLKYGSRWVSEERSRSADAFFG